jgi:hypothetical protein
MAQRVKIQLNSQAIADLLKSERVGDAVRGYAEAAAAIAKEHPSVIRHEVPVKVDMTVTDRQRAQVTLRHPAGVRIEAKYGVLAGAVRAAGMSFRKKRGR